MAALACRHPSTSSNEAHVGCSVRRPDTPSRQVRTLWCCCSTVMAYATSIVAAGTVTNERRPLGHRRTAPRTGRLPRRVSVPNGLCRDRDAGNPRRFEAGASGTMHQGQQAGETSDPEASHRCAVVEVPMARILRSSRPLARTALVPAPGRHQWSTAQRRQRREKRADRYSGPVHGPSTLERRKRCSVVSSGKLERLSCIVCQGEKTLGLMSPISAPDALIAPTCAGLRPRSIRGARRRCW